MSAPPRFAIEAAVNAARLSECAKSKRGVAVFAGPHVLGLGYNAQPAPFACTADDRCRVACGKLCEHAEQVAIRDALVELTHRTGRRCETLRGCNLVHAKVVDGQLVAGGGPSCWQCSRLVLAVQLYGVWLFEEAGGPAWRYYTAEEFHRATLAACGIGGPR